MRKIALSSCLRYSTLNYHDLGDGKPSTTTEEETFFNW